AAFPSKLKVRTFFADVKESEGKEPKDEIPAGKDCSAKTCKRCECPRCPICPECPDGFKPREKVPLASTEGKIASKEDNCPSCLECPPCPTCPTKCEPCFKIGTKEQFL
ncbi:unnamed protein product, partial [Effrenium voratum]